MLSQAATALVNTSLIIIVIPLFSCPSPDNRGGEEYGGLRGGDRTLPELLQQPTHAAEAETFLKECQMYIGFRTIKEESTSR